MNQHVPIAQKLQQIEAYLHNLVDSLQQGKFPVNIKRITQIFDEAMISIPHISLGMEKFVALYNDIPSVLSAYAINVSLRAESYSQGESQQIVFERLARGNYWIILLAATPSYAWLVPNPTRSIDITRSKSLRFVFDWPELHPGSSQATIALVEPALVSILPTNPLAWKLVKRGKISTFLNADLQQQSLSFQGVEYVSRGEVEKIVADAVERRFAELNYQRLDPLSALPQAKYEGLDDLTLSADLGNCNHQLEGVAVMSVDDGNNQTETEVIPQDAQAYYRQAVTKMQTLKDPAGALNDFDRAIQLNPSFALAYNGRAYLKEEMLNDVDGALLDYNQAISHDAQFATGFYNRGALKGEKMHDRDGAIQDLMEAAKIYCEREEHDNLHDTIGKLRLLGVPLQ